MPIALIARSGETSAVTAEAGASIGVPVVTATADSTDNVPVVDALKQGCPGGAIP
ncbi:hypothetical protein [Streptosporangium sp. CA-115845]|uniref:hypothetical protein n=1 Tax=Streptosporangium sp. CA-115845 TaxID=3240071 RepID=UPI003D8D65C1